MPGTPDIENNWGRSSGWKARAPTEPKAQALESPTSVGLSGSLELGGSEVGWVDLYR